MVVRRVKSYTAQTGFVYQYYFVGKRTGLRVDGDSAIEYIFDVTADRKTIFSVSVFLLSEALERWARAHGRSLSDTEQYASAKMMLFKSFDEVVDMRNSGRKLEINSDNIEEVLEPLDLG